MGEKLARRPFRTVLPLQNLGCCESGLPLTVFPGREITSDTLLLSRIASDTDFRVCIDLGTGTGEILRNISHGNGFRVGIDISRDALSSFDRDFGQPVLCPVEQVTSTFRKGCSDLVLANPPYNIAGAARISPDPGRAEARSGSSMLLHRFIFAGAYLLKSGGLMAVSICSDREDETVLSLKAAGFQSIQKFRAGGAVAFSAVSR